MLKPPRILCFILTHKDILLSVYCIKILTVNYMLYAIQDLISNWKLLFVEILKWISVFQLGIFSLELERKYI